VGLLPSRLVFAKVIDSPEDFADSFSTAMINRTVPARQNTHKA
jgi:hypothetical protein